MVVKSKRGECSFQEAIPNYLMQSKYLDRSISRGMLAPPKPPLSKASFHFSTNKKGSLVCYNHDEKLVDI